MNLSIRKTLTALSVLATMIAVSACTQAVQPEPAQNQGTAMKTDEEGVTVQCNNLPILILPATVGTEKMCTMNLNLKGVKSAKLFLVCYDIDELSETEVTLNDQVITLPEEVVGDMLEVSVELDIGINSLLDGENVLKFKFADNPGGTQGFNIYDAAIVLVK